MTRRRVTLPAAAAGAAAAVVGLVLLAGASAQRAGVELLQSEVRAISRCSLSRMSGRLEIDAGMTCSWTFLRSWQQGGVLTLSPMLLGTCIGCAEGAQVAAFRHLLSASGAG